MRDIRLPRLSECRVFFDFDNTITFFDVLDDIIERFSINRDWVGFERAWKRREIGSSDCLKGQLQSVRITKKDFLVYLSLIRIDPRFHKFIAILKKERMKPVIVSDSFSFIIKFILKNNGITGIRVYANTLKFSKDRLIPLFPHTNNQCRLCAHCKRNTLKKDASDKVIIYIGDGRSDICPAEYSDLVFAKRSLLEHFRKTKRLCIGFNNLDDIYGYLKGLEK
jgi:2-hydroxy-3-keto-5-methylthiopentenyl-1-phosphate phosphatase